MTNSAIENTDFKLVKSVLILFLFQMSFSFAIGTAIYVFTDLIMLLPSSLGDNHSLASVGMICGGLCFGGWMEKRYPEMLDKSRIKKISRWCAIMNLILTLLILSAVLFSDNLLGEPIGLGGLAVIAGFILFIVIMTYFITTFSISCGVKGFKRRQEKASATS